MSEGRKLLGQLLAINALAALTGAAVGGAVSGTWTWAAAGQSAAGSFLVSTIISGLCVIVLTRIAPPLFHRTSPLVRWSVIIVTLIAMAAIGTLLAVAAIAAVGLLPRNWETFVDTYQDTLATATVITLLFGIFSVVNETLRTRLADATLSLRTKERDEAEARRIASESQLASLESRVNPHFFFNTLNSIAALTREDPVGAERMTTQLAALMRTSLDHGTAPLVPLAQEERMVRDYLEIEHVRFGDRLRFAIAIPDASRDLLVPRLALQTIVENSIKYAVSPRRDGGTVSIGAAVTGARLRVEVVDDGPGFDGAALPEGHGLSMLRHRLAMHFGEQAWLFVERRDGGTAVGIDVPCQTGAA